MSNFISLRMINSMSKNTKNVGKAKSEIENIIREIFAPNARRTYINSELTSHEEYSWKKTHIWWSELGVVGIF